MKIHPTESLSLAMRQHRALLARPCTQNKLTLVSIRPCDYVSYRAFIMFDGVCYIVGPFEDEGRAWRTFASMIGHWYLRGFGLFSVIMRVNGQLMGFVGNRWPEDFPEREIVWMLLASAAGKGIAFEVAREVRQQSFHTLGRPTAVGYIKRENTRSIRLAKRLGAVRDTNAACPRVCALLYRHTPPSVSPKNCDALFSEGAQWITRRRTGLRNRSIW